MLIKLNLYPYFQKIKDNPLVTDSYRHKGLRAKLIDDLRKKGVRNEQVLEAMNKVPRHVFMESSFVEFSYRDKAFPIAAGQTISQPYTVAFQTSLLEVERFDKVLEIGTGSGYQTAILLELGARVYTIERQRDLYNRASMALPKMGYRPNFFYGDGFEGLPTYAPFDKILITAGADELPLKLIEQLRPGGRMVIPHGGTDVQVMKLLIKNADGSVEESSHGNFMFVPMLKGRVL